MKTLHLDLKLAGDNYVELRYFCDNPNQYEKRSLPLGQIADLIQLAEQDYYVRLAVDYTITGRKLYNWLDGSDRLLQRLLNQHQGEGIVLAIATAEKLAHLPWEVLHDGNSFLVERMPGVIPVRWVSSDAVKQLSIEAEPENRALQVLFMATSPLGVEPVLDFEAEEGRILGADLRKKCNRLSAFDAKSQVDEALQSQARRLADGNPRLLEWLNDKIRQNSPLDQTAILNRLEADPVELREQVLAEALLVQIDQPLKEMLQRGLVFELPVPREAIAAVCESIPNLEQQINRAVALGLLEVSPDSSLRVPRILPLNLPEDAEALHKQGATVLYRLWWEGAESPTKEQGLEIHRLALRGKEKEIAAQTANVLASHWKNQGRYCEVVQLCNSTLKIAKDYRVLHQLARAEECLGDVSKALEHYQQALDLCPPEDEKAKGDIIHNLAEIYATQRQTEKALALNQQFLELTERIGDNQGKASALHQQACLKLDQGQSDEALALYEQSFDLESDIQGKAATLHQMGIIKANQEKIEEAIAFFKQSLALKESMGNVYNVYGKAMTLQWLGILVARQGDVFAALEYLLESLEILEWLQSPEAEKVRKFIALTIIARVQQMAQSGG
ncbi:MAG TPA: tetratricopeptide repeat protein [Coleofasciculaceae cyanobacterium]